MPRTGTDSDQARRGPPGARLRDARDGFSRCRRCAGLPAGDGVDRGAAVPRHGLDDAVDLARLEKIDQLLMVPVRGFAAHQAGEGIGSRGVPQILQETKQAGTFGPLKGHEMELAVESQVFRPLAAVAKQPQLAGQVAHFRDIAVRQPRNRHRECLGLE